MVLQVDDGRKGLFAQRATRRGVHGEKSRTRLGPGPLLIGATGATTCPVILKKLGRFERRNSTFFNHVSWGALSGVIEAI